MLQQQGQKNQGPPTVIPRFSFFHSAFTLGERKPPPSVGDAAPRPGHPGLRSTRICRTELQLCGWGGREGVDAGEGAVSLLFVLCLTLGLITPF